MPHEKEPGATKALALPLLVVTLVTLSLPGLVSRSIWHDEAITLLETGNGSTPWPDEPVAAANLRPAFEGRRSFGGIAHLLRVTDVHPPLYYWLLSHWRSVVGSSLFAARLFSLVLMLACVVAFFRLLKSGGMRNPVLPGLFFVLSTLIVHYSHEARNYALALLAVLGAASTAWRVEHTGNSRPTFRDYALTIAAAMLCSIAVLSNYLAVSSAVALLIWFASITWRRSRRLAALLPVTTTGLAAAAYFSLGLYEQLGSRAHQDAGFRGVIIEIKGLLVSMLNVFCGGQSLLGPRSLVLLLAGLVALTAVGLFRNGAGTERLDRRLVWLFVLFLVASPAVVFSMDLLLDKHLYGSSRYLLFSAPALAILATHGAATGRGLQRAVGLTLLGALAVAQLMSVNWGRDYCPGSGFGGGHQREVARVIAASEAKKVALVGIGWGRGDPWSYVYELAPEIPVIFVHWRTDPAKVVQAVAAYEEVWLLRAFARGASEEPESAAWRALLESGRYYEASVIARGHDRAPWERKVNRAVRRPACKSNGENLSTSAGSRARAVAR